MTILVGGCDHQRVVDRIRANTYKEAIEADAIYIYRKQIVQNHHCGVNCVAVSKQMYFPEIQNKESND